MFDFREIFTDQHFMVSIAYIKCEGKRLDDGQWLEVHADPHMIQAVVLPLSSEELLILPEGERYLPSLKLLTDFEMVIGDFVVYLNQTYRIISTPEWSNYGYHTAIAIGHERIEKPDTGGFVFT